MRTIDVRFVTERRAQSGANAAVPPPDQHGQDDVFDLFEVEPIEPDEPVDDRRASARFVPDGTIEVFVDPDDPAADALRAELVDLGDGGLCVDRPDGDGLGEGRVQVLLPGESWPLVLWVRLCHHRPIGAGRVRCGYRIDWACTVAAGAQSETLSAWIGALGGRTWA